MGMETMSKPESLQHKRAEVREGDIGLREGALADNQMEQAAKNADRVNRYTLKLEDINAKIETANQEIAKGGSLSGVYEKILKELEEEREKLVAEFSGDTERGSDTLQ